jgi:hypothetical protein
MLLLIYAASSATLVPLRLVDYAVGVVSNVPNLCFTPLNTPTNTNIYLM